MQTRLIIKTAVTAILLWQAAVTVNAQGLTTAAGKDGIFVYCGKELPKKFSYVIERKQAGDTAWQIIAETIFPKTVDGLEGNILAAPSSILLNQKPREAVAAKVWQRSQPATTLDSLHPYADMPLYVLAMGCGYFDKVAAAGMYSYKISIMKNGVKQEIAVNEVSYPAKRYMGTIEPVKMAIADEEIALTFSINDPSILGGAKVFRAKFGDTIFTQVPVKVLFTGSEDGKLQLDITDASVTRKMAYSYYVVPLDYLGNEGLRSEVINVVNSSKLHDIGQVLRINAKGIDAEKTIKLSWLLKSSSDLISIDIYRGTNYYEPFSRIASVAPSDTVYIDQNINPTTTYYYSIAANGNFGRSNPSARVGAILKGESNNLFPPQNITASRKGNVVAIKFNKAESDTRGYYVYRGEGYTGKLVALQKMLLSTDSSITYYDTLPFSSSLKIYSYSVADVNTSYKISPQSSKFSIVYGGAVPIPTRVNVKKTGKNVLVVWDKTAPNHAVTGYNIYRTATDEDGVVKATNQLISTKPVADSINSYIDSIVTEGWHYSYVVQSIGVQNDEISSFSSNASITLPAVLPLAPGNVSVMSALQNVTLKWDAPADASVKTIKVYRAVANGELKMIKELPVDKTEFNDTDVVADTTYFYSLATATAKNKESKKTDIVGIRVK